MNINLRTFLTFSMVRSLSLLFGLRVLFLFNDAGNGDRARGDYDDAARDAADQQPVELAALACAVTPGAALGGSYDLGDFGLVALNDLEAVGVVLDARFDVRGGDGPQVVKMSLLSIQSVASKPSKMARLSN